MAMPIEKTPILYPVNDDAGAVVKDISENYVTGFIKLFRSIREHWIWEDEKKFKWWVDILMECNHESRKVPIGFELFECKRGQTLHSRLEWSKRWRVDESTVRRFLALLEADKMVKLENLKKTTRLTVCNYGSYNDKQPKKDQRRKSDASQTQYEQECKELKEYSTDAWRHTHKGFFERQYEANRDKQLAGEYLDLIKFLHGENKSGIFFSNVLSLERQISYRDFVILKETASHTSKTIGHVLVSMENTAKLKSKYKNVFLTVNNWLKNDFNKK